MKNKLDIKIKLNKMLWAEIKKKTTKSIKIKINSNKKIRIKVDRNTNLHDSCFFKGLV
jgi:hypothetical protein